MPLFPANGSHAKRAVNNMVLWHMRLPWSGPTQRPRRAAHVSFQGPSRISRSDRAGCIPENPGMLDILRVWGACHSILDHAVQESYPHTLCGVEHVVREGANNCGSGPKRARSD
eukprot:5390974-Pyramimonas_sp.AAC.1